MDIWLFYLFALVIVGASLGVIGQRSPMHSVLFLILSFGALAALYVQLDSPFAAVAQIIIYAGAIMVLFLFVVMLLNASHEDDDPGARAPVPVGVKVSGCLLALLLLVELTWALTRVGRPAVEKDAASADSVSSVHEIGRVLFTDYAFAFEVTSVLILVAMIGAVVLAKRKV
ncbi:MAG: NADH-quinone oxidoreductase subunit J [Luteitalea sp.]|nr:NADH-quinone oxidoreductase subunit J [Luteitalea sp.]